MSQAQKEVMFQGLIVGVVVAVVGTLAGLVLTGDERYVGRPVFDMHETNMVERLDRIEDKVDALIQMRVQDNVGNRKQ